jgi:hypothetical protein
MRHFESAVSLLGLAITILAWIVPQDRIRYDVKFALLGAGLMAIGLGVVLLLLLPRCYQDRTNQPH